MGQKDRPVNELCQGFVRNRRHERALSEAPQAEEGMLVLPLPALSHYTVIGTVRERLAAQ